ncbi:hypothetical protein M6B38_316585 [Iris pallida]|uniref:Uncharacterized protein n=1 Tax=Iris pallida TaxID=29817 RepID=A0AAX6HDM7_IRIPA|nr:hypothetical protein M6B38_316585 [Iris pallida]
MCAKQMPSPRNWAVSTLSLVGKMFSIKDVAKGLDNNILLSCRRCRMLITPRPWIGQMIIWQDGNMNENDGLFLSFLIMHYMFSS